MNWILEEKKDINGKLVKSEYGLQFNTTANNIAPMLTSWF